MNMNEYDDYNYYCRFISSQLAWRDELINRKVFKPDLSNEVFYQYSIINASGLRAGGATTAIGALINPKSDLYVGFGHCDQMKDIIVQRGFNKKDLTFLNFNSITFDNTNFDEDELANKIGKFFSDNNMEIMKFNNTNQFYPSRYVPKFEQVDISSVKRDLSRSLVWGQKSDNHDVLQKLRGLSKIRVFIDIGNQHHRLYCNRVNRLINWLRMYVPSNELVVILT